MTFTAEEQQALNGSRPRCKSGKTQSDRHASTVTNANQTAGENSTALASTAQVNQSKVNASLRRIADTRNDAIEHVSDVLAYLHSPATFEAEVLQRTAEKLGLTQPDQGDDHLTLDGLADCFADFTTSLDYPTLAIAPHTPAGALPL